jgi:hypothetical protein
LTNTTFCRKFHKDLKRFISIEDNDVIINVKRKKLWTGRTQHVLELVNSYSWLCPRCTPQRA